MANRTVIVDNNTWNNTHIATVGTAMSSPEKAAWEIFNSLDVKYVLVVFGGWAFVILLRQSCLWLKVYHSNEWHILLGLVGYPSDDINKFLWMVRIGGGVFPHIKEPDYLVFSSLVTLRGSTISDFISNFFATQECDWLFAFLPVSEERWSISNWFSGNPNYVKLSHVQTLILQVRHCQTFHSLLCVMGMYGLMY